MSSLELARSLVLGESLVAKALVQEVGGQGAPRTPGTAQQIRALAQEGRTLLELLASPRAEADTPTRHEETSGVRSIAALESGARPGSAKAAAAGQNYDELDPGEAGTVSTATQEAWVELQYRGPQQYDTVTEQRLVNTLALVAGVPSSAVSRTHMQKFEGAHGDYMAIKVRIHHPQHKVAWELAQAGSEKIASRLECHSIHVSAEQPDWSNLEWRQQGAPSQPTRSGAAAQADHDMASARGEEHAGEPAGNSGDAGARGIIKQGSLYVMQRALQKHGQTAPPSAGVSWRRAWFQLVVSKASTVVDEFELRMFRSPPSPSSSGSSVPLAAFSLEGAEFSCLAGAATTGFELRVGGSRKLRLKCEGVGELSSWVTALASVPGMQEALPSLGGSDGPPEPGDAERARLFTEGLAGLTGAVLKEAVAPLSSACSAMAASQARLGERLDLLAHQWGQVSSGLGGVGALQEEERADMREREGLRRPVAEAEVPVNESAARESVAGLEFAGGVDCAVKPGQARIEPRDIDGYFGHHTGMASAAGAGQHGMDDARAKGLGRQGPCDTDFSDLTPRSQSGRVRLRRRGGGCAELQEGWDTWGDKALPTKNFCWLHSGEAAGVEHSTGLRHAASTHNASTQMAMVEDAVRKTQKDNRYGPDEMPLLEHVRKSGFAAEALAIAYDLGGREAVAARLGLRVAPDAVAMSRFADWQNVEKAVRRAAASLREYQRRQELTRRAKVAASGARGSKRARLARATAAQGQSMSDAALEPAAKLRMPNGKQLCAQGMEQVDKAIREVHGGHAAVAHKLDLLPPIPEIAVKRAPRTRPWQVGVPGAGLPAAESAGFGLGSAPRCTVEREPLAPSLWGGKAFRFSIPKSQGARYFQDFNNVRLVIEELVRQGSPGGLHLQPLRRRDLRWMPTERQLVEHGLDDVLQAIQLWHGGMHQAARKLGKRIQGPGERAMRASMRTPDEDSIAAETHIKHHPTQWSSRDVIFSSGP